MNMSNQMNTNFPMNMNNVNFPMKNNQFNNNNINVNTSIVLNNINNNRSNNNLNNPNQQIQQENLIFVTFTFKKNKKQIYLDLNENDTFENVLSQLVDKYNWLAMFKNKSFYFNNKKITDYKVSIKKLGIIENSDIIINSD